MDIKQFSEIFSTSHIFFAFLPSRYLRTRINRSSQTGFQPHRRWNSLVELPDGGRATGDEK